VCVYACVFVCAAVARPVSETLFAKFPNSWVVTKVSAPLDIAKITGVLVGQKRTISIYSPTHERKQGETEPTRTPTRISRTDKQRGRAHFWILH
jgi:hypothetical protein